MKEAPLPSLSPERGAEKGLWLRQISFLGNGPYSMDIAPGECVGLTGRSGVGKTQLLRAVADVMGHDGDCFLDEEPCSAVSPPRWRQMVAMVPAESFWWYDTVGAHFEQPARTTYFHALLKTFGFGEEVMGWQISRLSTGERQRLALIRTLVTVPRVLLLDEPTSALDKAMVAVVEETVGEICIREKCLCLWVSHDMEQLARVANRIFRVEENGFSAEDSP